MSENLKRVFLSAAAALLMLAQPFPALAAEDALLRMEVQYGYGGSAKGGRTLPVRVSAENLSGQSFDGSLEVMTRQSDGEIYSFNYPFSAESGEAAEGIYAVPLGVGSDELLVRLKDGDTVAAEEKLHLNISSAVPELFIGVLSDRPEALDYFGDVSLNYGQMRTRLFGLTEETMPADRSLMDLLDVMIISSYDMAKLDVEKTHALMRWVQEGGVLVFGTGERIDDTLGMFAPEFLDEMYERPELTEISFDELKNADEPGRNTVPLVAAEISLHGGSTVLSLDSVPIIDAVNKGKGVFAVCTLDLTDLSGVPAAGSTFAEVLLERTLGSSRMERLASEAYGTEYNEYWAAQSLIDTGFPGHLPNLGFFAVLLGMHMVFTGPVLWFGLRKLGLIKRYRSFAAAVSVIFAGAVVIVGGAARYRGPFYTYAVIRDASVDTVNETAYINLRTPYRNPYSIMIPGKYTAIPLTTTFHQEKQEELIGTEVPDVIVGKEEAGTKIELSSPAAFDTCFFRLEDSSSNPAGECFYGDPVVFGGLVSGSVVNAYPYDIENAALILYGKVVPIGDLKSGETVDLSTRPVYRIPLNASDTVAAFLTGVYDGSLGREKHLRALERANFLSFYLSQNINGYAADASLVGFAADTGDKQAEIGGDLQNSGMLLLTSQLTVTTEQDGLICRPGLVRTPEIFSGDYIAETNSFYKGETVVLGYFLGSDIEVREIVFEAPDPLFGTGDSGSGSRTFRGKTALYNYYTGSFEELEESSEPVYEGQLRKYLSPDNMLMVRYSESGDVPGTGIDISLPIPYVIGEVY